ncbi:class I SAM-dependent methyltransferase [Gaetbulibacter sp. M235]|uniref:O-methyltransferase n=1 Tax=Gaetbulibacter sp. M235 TaxID=3126510 RepID=UPI00374EA01E
MFYQITQYIKFLSKSTNQHGVHSPFVYDLITKCFYDKTNYEAYKNMSEYRKELLSNKMLISVTDLGSGSQKLKSNTRSVSKMAKHAGTTYFRAKLLYRIVKYFNSKNILELGTSLGIATHAMQLGNPKAMITTVEGCNNLTAFTKANFLKYQLNGITLINDNFQSAFKNVNKNSFDLVFFDGNHQKESTLQYFEAMLPSIHNDALFIFDDIYWSKEMTEAWETIKQHPKVTVTIDTFHWGLVFFRSEQNKEHFIIRV